MSLLKLSAQNATPLGVRSFFIDVVLPKLEENWLGDGVLAFALTGDGGGDFTLDLGTGELFVGRSEDVDCTVRASTDAFLALVRGTLPVDEAMEEIHIHGALSVLDDFATLLEGSPS